MPTQPLTLTCFRRSAMELPLPASRRLRSSCPFRSAISRAIAARGRSARSASRRAAPSRSTSARSPAAGGVTAPPDRASAASSARSRSFSTSNAVDPRLLSLPPAPTVASLSFKAGIRILEDLEEGHGSLKCSSGSMNSVVTQASGVSQGGGPGLRLCRIPHCRV